jgi:hypothetical protein
MPRKKDRLTIEGGQLLTQGDVIQVMDEGLPVKCLVRSCLAAEDGSCLAGLEILEGERKGERISTRLKACQPGTQREE